MPYCGITGEWFEALDWHGGVDDAGLPDGHGVLAFPAKDWREYMEGGMAAGRRQGTWAAKFRDGTWHSCQFTDDAERDFKVCSKPHPRFPPAFFELAFKPHPARGGPWVAAAASALCLP